MATDQTLSVKITGDTSGLVKATNTAAKSLSDLQQDVKDVDSASIDIKVQSNTGTTVSELDDLKKKADTLDSESIEIPADIELKNINRDIANLNKVLAGIEKQKAEPDVGFDLVQLNRDQAKVRKAIDDLDKRKATITADFDVDTGGLERAAGAVSTLGAGGGGLANLVSFLGKGKALWAGAIGGAAVAAGNFVQMSADAETARANLDTLTGSVQAGGAMFDDLNKFAADTPFEFDGIVAASQRLLAAGIPIDEVTETLTAVGDAASATSGEIDDVAGIYAQMWGKGKVSNEEMLQLQERGIDAYGVLAKKMGLTVGQIQDMASENKLGIDAVKTLRGEMEKAYGGSMARQAETLNGKLSTMKDTLGQIGVDVGNVFAPAVEAAVDAVTVLAGKIDLVLDKRTELQEAAKAPDASGWEKIFGVFTKSLPEMVGFFKEKTFDVWTGKTKEAADNTKDAADETTRLKEQQKKAAEQAAIHAQKMEQAKQAIKDAKEALDAAADSYSKIGENIRTRVSFVFEKVDAQAEIDKLFKGAHPVQLPADLKFKDLATLGGRQRELISNVASMVESGLEEGSRRAKTAATLGVKFDEDAWYRQVRETARKTLIRANIDPSQIERVLTNVLGLPRPVDVKPEVHNLDAAGQKLDDLTHPRTAPINPLVHTAPAKSRFDDLTEPRTAPIHAKPVDVGKTDNVLDGVAHDRTVHYNLVFNESLYAHMDDRLDRLAGTRTVSFSGSGAVGGVSAPRGVSVGGTMWTEPLAGGPMLMASQQMAAGAQTMFLPSQGGQRTTYVAPPPTQIRPRQTPIAVYLDGEEIATHMELRAKRLAASNIVTGRRA